MPSQTLLLVDENSSRGRRLHQHFRSLGWEVVWVTSGDEVEPFVTTRGIAPLVAIVAEGQSWRPGPRAVMEWIALSANPATATAGDEMAGAFAVNRWPSAPYEIGILVSSAARLAMLRRDRELNQASERARFSLDSYLGTSESAVNLRARLDQAIRDDKRVVLIGERGSGKRLVAQILHWAGQRNESGPFIEYDFRSQEEREWAPRLFGREASHTNDTPGRIAGLLEQARGGTLHIRSFVPLPPALVSRLDLLDRERMIRRVGGVLDVAIGARLVISFSAVAERGDAHTLPSDDFGTDQTSIVLPPLRMRRGDILVMAPAFIAECSRRLGKTAPGLTGDGREALLSYDWPGNVAELKNVLERATLIAEERSVSLESFLGTSTLARPFRSSQSISFPLNGSLSLEEMDRAIISAALEETHFNTLAAARLLRTTRQTLRYRIDKYGLKGKSSSGNEQNDSAAVS